MQLAGDLPPPATVLALVITFAILGCCCLTCCLLVGWNVKKAYLDLLPYKPPPNPNEVKKEVRIGGEGRQKPKLLGDTTCCFQLRYDF